MKEAARELGLTRINTKPLTAAESQRLEPMLISGIVAASELSDWFISHSNKAHATAIIWQMDEEDAAVIASFIMLGGKKSGRVAMGIRGASHVANLYDLGKITAPKFGQMFLFYARNGGFGW